MKIAIASVFSLLLLVSLSGPAALGQTQEKHGKSGGLQAHEVELERLFLDAELLLDSERKPREAAKLFRRVYKDRFAPRVLKAESLAGLVRCERLLGNERKAASLWRELVEEFSDLPSVSREILRLSTGALGSTYLSGVELVPEGKFLDLDTGGVITAIRSGSGSTPELMVKDREVVFLTTARPDPGMDNLAQPIYGVPWQRVHTDLGRTAWVQIVGKAEPVAIHFYTALSGIQSILPAPRNSFCVGKGKGIEVHFEADDTFSSYRIERQDGAVEPFRVLKTVRKGPFNDDTALPGNRYVYKITGIAANEAESLPATVGGATNSRGVISGTVALAWGGSGALPSFDFLTGECLGEGGDLTITGTYGGQSAASFADNHGISAIAVPGEMPPGRSPWSKQIPPYVPFHVHLRGGGLARCLWKPIDNHEVLVEFEANPDGTDLDRRPVVTVEAGKGSAKVTVAAPEGFKADTVIAIDGESGAERLLTVRNGEARDREIRGKRFMTYSATCIDRYGRRTARGAITVNLAPPEMREGEFRFHEGQAYSFELGRRVPLDRGDVCFVDTAGGMSGVLLQAPAGISNLEWSRRSASSIGNFPREDLFNMIVSADPAALELHRRIWGDSRNACEDVFIMKTRFGGWAKLVISDRIRGKTPVQNSVAIRYVYNSCEPIFRDDDVTKTVVERGVTFDRSSLAASIVRLAWRRREMLDDLDQKAATMAAELAARRGKDVNVAALIGRSHARRLSLPDDYQVSTFNFLFETRDNTELVHNDWDILFANGSTPEIDIFDMSAIWDLGPVDFDTVAIADGHQFAKAEEAPAIKDHVYVIHNLDKDIDHWVKMQILEIERAEWIVFRWEFIDDVAKVIRLERLPDLEMKAPTVNIQIRAGAGGGNPNRLIMDGTTSAYVDGMSGAPLDMGTPPSMSEPSVGYFEGGFIPEGKVWVVKHIDFVARADGDSNGHGEFILQVGPFTIAHLQQDYGASCTLYTIDEGVQNLPDGETMLRHDVAMTVPLWPGDEKRVFAEVANSSLCNVVIRGEFADENRFRGERLRGVPALDRLTSFFFMVRDMDRSMGRAVLEQYARENKDLLPYLEAIYDAAEKGDYRELIEDMIEAIGG